MGGNFCTKSGKECFETREQAKKALERMTKKSVNKGSTYLCPWCNQWHISHFSYRVGKSLGQSIKKNKKGQ